jgi:hypothetical protein
MAKTVEKLVIDIGRGVHDNRQGIGWRRRTIIGIFSLPGIEAANEVGMNLDKRVRNSDQGSFHFSAVFLLVLIAQLIALFLLKAICRRKATTVAKAARAANPPEINVCQS